MDRVRKATLLVRLIQLMHENGSYCTERDMQNAVFAAQKLFLGFEFASLRNQPFSFDLQDELTSLCADGWVRLVSRDGPAMYLPTVLARKFQNIFADTMRQYEPALKSTVNFCCNRAKMSNNDNFAVSV